MKAVVFTQFPDVCHEEIKKLIDKNADQLAADGSMEEQSNHRGINPAAQAADNLFLADPLADFLNIGVNKGLHRP